MTKNRSRNPRITQGTIERIVSTHAALTKNRNHNSTDRHQSYIERVEKAQAALGARLVELKAQLKKDELNPDEFHHHSSIPELISEHRSRHSMTQGQLALLAGVVPNTMTKLNDEHTAMRVSTLLQVLESVGMTLYVGPLNE